LLITYNLLAANSRELTKLIQIGQKNTSNLNVILENQKRFEVMLNDQKAQISEIISRLDRYPVTETDVKLEGKEGKGKGKGKKRTDDFYQVNIYMIVIFLYIILVTYNYLCYRTQLKSSLMSYSMNMIVVI
jgi:hypothetical protein